MRRVISQAAFPGKTGNVLTNLPGVLIFTWSLIGCCCPNSWMTESSCLPCNVDFSVDLAEEGRLSVLHGLRNHSALGRWWMARVWEWPQNLHIPLLWPRVGVRGQGISAGFCHFWWKGQGQGKVDNPWRGWRELVWKDEEQDKNVGRERN